jgi:hypothetical protein
MKNTLRTYAGKGLLLAIAGTILLFAGCDKKDPEKYATPYVGTWKGGSACGGIASTSNGLVVKAGEDGITVITDIAVGDSACMVLKEFRGKADESNVTFAPQYYTDKCGVLWKVSGIASIYADTLTLTFTGTGEIKGLEVSGTCTFKGRK